MKRISLFLMAMLLTLSLCACGGEEITSGETTEGSRSDAVTAVTTTVLKTYFDRRSDEGCFEELPYTVKMNGDRIEVSFVYRDLVSREGRGTFDVSKYRIVGSYFISAGYYVVVPDIGYWTNTFEGPNAEEYFQEKLEWYDETLADENADETEKKEAQLSKDALISGAEIEVDMANFYNEHDGMSKVAFLLRVDFAKGLLYEWVETTDAIESMWTHADRRILFDYDENGVMTSSRILDENYGYDETYVEYYGNGNIKKITFLSKGSYGKDCRKKTFTFDEQGNIVSQTED